MNEFCFWTVTKIGQSERSNAMHIDTDLWAYFLSDAMSKKRLVYADDFGLKIVLFFLPQIG